MDATDWSELVIRPAVLICAVAAMVAVAAMAERFFGKESQR